MPRANLRFPRLPLWSTTRASFWAVSCSLRASGSPVLRWGCWLELLREISCCKFTGRGGPEPSFIRTLTFAIRISNSSSSSPYRLCWRFPSYLPTTGLSAGSAHILPSFHHVADLCQNADAGPAWNPGAGRGHCFISVPSPALLGRKIRGAESNPQCHAQGRDSVAAAGFGTGDCAEDATGLSRLLAHPYACGGPSRHGCDAGNVFNRYVCLGRAKHPFTRVLCSPRYLDPCNRRYCDDFSELAGLLDTLAAFAAPGPGIGQFHWRYCLHGDPFHPAEPPDSQCRCSQASGILLESLCGFRTGRMGVLRSDETVGTAYPLALGSRCPGSPHRGKHGGLAPDRARCQVASCPRAGTLFEKIEARVSNARTSLRRLKSSAGLVPQRRFAPGTHLAVHF